MNYDRRLLLAGLVEQHLPHLERAVIDSWRDLLPGSLEWDEASRIQAREAVETALRGLVTVIAQGDLDEESWAHTRAIVSAEGLARVEETGALLRTVRIVAVDQILHYLDHEVGLRDGERWTLQREVHSYTEGLQRQRDEVDPSTIDTVLADLATSKPDLA